MCAPSLDRADDFSIYNWTNGSLIPTCHAPKLARRLRSTSPQCWPFGGRNISFPRNKTNHISHHANTTLTPTHHFHIKMLQNPHAVTHRPPHPYLARPSHRGARIGNYRDGSYDGFQSPANVRGTVGWNSECGNYCLLFITD